IVSDGHHLAMEPTLAEALQVVFGAQPSTAEGMMEAPQAPTSGPREALSEADHALRRGDWTAFGRAWERLKSLLERRRGIAAEEPSRPRVRCNYLRSRAA